MVVFGGIGKSANNIVNVHLLKRVSECYNDSLSAVIAEATADELQHIHEIQAPELSPRTSALKDINEFVLVQPLDAHPNLRRFTQSRYAKVIAAQKGRLASSSRHAICGESPNS